MNKREHVERIIVSSLLNDDDDCRYYDEVKSCVTPAMFANTLCGELFSAIINLHKKGITKSWPDEVYKLYQGKMDKELFCFMYDIATNDDFLSKKISFNENILLSNAFHKRFTEVSFSDYVSKFLEYAIG